MPEYILTEREFFERFIPIGNHFDEESAFSGCMFETYGAELRFVNCIDKNQVWTVLDDGENLTIVSGLHSVNRFGYIITEVPVADGDFFEVKI